jgi:5-enolpyruvylshikimate-3-phosphate synthase
MKTPVPMPALIATIKSWKSANRIPKVEVAVQKPKEEDRLAALEETVAKLTARVEELEAKLSEKTS